MNYLSLVEQNESICSQALSEIERHILSGDYILPATTTRFEEAFAQSRQASYCISTTNGSTALLLALLAAGVRAGDYVIVPDHTFIATWQSISLLGAIPVSVPVNRDNYVITKESLSTLDKSLKYKAIIVVHLYGYPANVGEVKKNLPSPDTIIIEDCAQAHGSKFDNLPIGANSDLAAWSFYPGKNLGALGDAGAVTTNSKFLSERIRELRSYGSPSKYVHTHIGLNARIDPIQAILLFHKLDQYKDLQEKRYSIARYYLLNISNPYISLPAEAPPNDMHGYHQFVVQTPAREKLKSYLQKLDIPTMIHYPIPIISQECYSKANYISTSNNPRSFNDRILSLPICPELKISDIEHIVRALNEFSLY